MIKSTKTTLKFANTAKLDNLADFINEYRNIVEHFVNNLWELPKIPILLPKEMTSNINSWLSARAIQCAAKQASGIVRGVRKKQAKRLFIINKFNRLGMFLKARKLQTIYDAIKISKPKISLVQPELDGRFVEIELDNKTSFDGWFTLSSLGNKLKCVIPFKKSKHFNKMLQKGNLKTGVRLSKSNITFMFDLPESIKVVDGKTIGIDIGQITTLSVSDGQTISTDSHGHNYQSICQRLARKKKDSKNFNQTVNHRTNFIHWSINQLNLNGVKKVNLENIKHLRRGKRNSRLMSHWNYAELFDKLKTKLLDSGVQVKKVSSTFTSQRCSACGWTRKGNRKGKRFKCDKCNFTHDADLNAALNISFDLPSISKVERLQHKNRAGFYWNVPKNVVSEAPIVPHIQKAIFT